MSKMEKRPTSDVVVNGTKLKGLWDSGADISCMALAQYKKLKVKPHLNRFTNTLTSANGSEIKSRGSARLQFSVGKFNFAHEVVIVDNLKSNLIIGSDIMADHGFILDMAARQIKKNHRVNEIRGDNPIGRSNHSFTVEPLQARVLEIKMDGTPGQSYIVSGKHVPEGFCQINDYGKTKIIVANRTLLPIQINRGDQLCTFEKAARSATRHFSVKEIRANNGEGNMKFKGELNTNIGDGSSRNKLNAEQLAVALKEVPNKLKQVFTNLLEKYSAVFSVNPDDIGFTDAVTARIVLKDKNAIASKPPYRLPVHLMSIVEAYINKLLKQGVIEPCDSAFSSPVMLIKKPGFDPNSKDLLGQWRLVHNYKLLNSLCVKINYPMHQCFDLLDRISSGAIFSKIDLTSGYFQQNLHEDSRDYTAFSLPHLGSWRYKRSSMGLVNSAAYFQRLLNKVTAGIKGCYVYIDDILIVNDNIEDHLKTLEEVFQRLKQYNLKCRLSKLELATNKINFLGYEISKESGVRAGEIKTRAIREHKEPHSLTLVKSFLGLAGYYRRTIPYFSQIAKPLTQLLRKDSGYTKGPLPPLAKEAFETLRAKLSTRPCLAPINWKKDFIVIVDSSSEGSAGALCQIGDDGIERPCIYISRTHSEAESKRPAFAQEASGVVWAMRLFKPVILGARQITIKSDHRPLAKTHKSSSPMLDKLHAELQEFNYSMEYLPGDKIPTDSLSRNLHRDCQFCNGKIAERHKSIVISEISQSLLSTSICDLRPAKFRVSQISEKTTMPLSDSQLYMLQKNDKWCKSMVCFLIYGRLPDSVQLRKWVETHAHQARIENGLLGLWDGGKFRVFAPLDIRHTLLHLAHDHQLAGHQGINKTSARLSQWFWPHMQPEIDQYVKNCIKCQQNNPPNHFTKMPLQELPVAHKFLSRCALDLIGPYPASGKEGFKYCLVVSDAYSSFVKVIPIINKTAEEVSKAFLEGFVTHYSLPDYLEMDAGSEFVSKVFKNLADKLGCQLRYATVDHHVGQVERANRSVVAYLRKYIGNRQKDWSEMINHLMFALNTSVHRDKLMSPYEMVFATKPTTSTNYLVPPINYSDDEFTQLVDRHFRIQKEVQSNKHEAFVKQKIQFDKRMKERNFKVGDVVFIKNFTNSKFESPWRGPFRVANLLGDGNLEAESLATGRRYKVHSNLVKPGSATEQVSRRTISSYDTIKRQEEDECIADGGETADLASSDGRITKSNALKNQFSSDRRSSLQHGGRPPDAPGNRQTAHSPMQTADNAPYKRMTRSSGKITDQEFRKLLSVIESWQNNQLYYPATY